MPQGHSPHVRLRLLGRFATRSEPELEPVYVDVSAKRHEQAVARRLPSGHLHPQYFFAVHDVSGVQIHFPRGRRS